MLKRLKIKSFLFKSMSSIPPWHQTSRFPYFDPWKKGTTRGEEPRTLSGGKYTISAIPGVGIGPELMEHVIDVFDCIGAPTVFEWLPLEKNDDLEIQNIILSIRRNGIGIKGNIEIKKPMQFAGFSSGISKNSTFRKDLDLFVNVSRFKNFRSLRDRVKIKRDIDIVLMRGNHEGEFHLVEHSPMKNLVENYKVVTAYNAKRLSIYAFNYALQHKRRKITLARNMEITPLCDNLFAKETATVALKYPTIQFEQLSENATLQKALKNPEELDIVMCNGLTGSLFPPILSGILGGTNIGCLGQISERYGVFEPSGRIRGSRLIKKDIANPTAFLLAGASALHALKATNHYRCLMDGLEDTFKEGVMTKDIGGTATTTEFIKALVENMKSKMPTILCKYDNPQSKNNPK